MSEITIREFQPEDRAVVEQCIMELQEDEHERRPYFWLPASPEIAKTLLDEFVNKLREDAEIKIYVGVLDGKVAGWILVKTVDPQSPDVALKKYGYINELGVLREYQKRGIGLALMNKAEEFIKSLDLEWMGLNTNPQNPALGFYKNLGYTEGSIRMEKKLT